MRISFLVLKLIYGALTFLTVKDHDYNGFGWLRRQPINPNYGTETLNVSSDRDLPSCVANLLIPITGLKPMDCLLGMGYLIFVANLLIPITGLKPLLKMFNAIANQGVANLLIPITGLKLKMERAEPTLTPRRQPINPNYGTETSA